MRFSAIGNVARDTERSPTCCSVGLYRRSTSRDTASVFKVWGIPDGKISENEWTALKLRLEMYCAALQQQYRLYNVHDRFVYCTDVAAFLSEADLGIRFKGVGGHFVLHFHFDLPCRFQVDWYRLKKCFVTSRLFAVISEIIKIKMLEWFGGQRPCAPTQQLAMALVDLS